MKHRIIGFLIFIVMIFSYSFVFCEESENDLEITAEAAVLMDFQTGKVLYGKNINKELPPASVTKIMTLLLLMEAIDEGSANYTDEVTISEYAANMGGSQLYMEVGEKHKVEDLIYAIAVESANDACGAIAEYLGGDINSFTKMMNKRAEELGMKNTNFMNSNGLPSENHYSSAYDIALMSRELLKHDDIFKYTKTWMYDMKIGVNKEKVRTLSNTNKLIKSNPKVDGLKTGYTAEAGHCISATGKSGDLRLIAVILKGSDSKMRFNEASALLNYGFNKYEISIEVKKEDVVGEINVEKGSAEKIDLIAKEDISFLKSKNEDVDITKEIVIDKEYLNAPVKKGEVVGKVVCKNKGEVIGKSDIIISRDVTKEKFLSYTKGLYKKLFALV